MEFSGGSPSFRLNYLNTIAFALLPFGIFLISAAFWGIYGYCSKMPPQDRIDKTVATAVIVLFLFYPTIVKKMAQSVNCVQIDGVDRLYNDLEEECFTGTHFYIFFFVSLPALLAWAVVSQSSP